MQNIINAVAPLSVMGLIFAAILAFASQIFAVEKDPKTDEIEKVLPGANCGGCGFPGCAGLAKAIAEGAAPVNGCPVGGESVAIKVAEIMGVSASGSERKVANVHCNGGNDKAVERSKYVGVLDCNAAMIASGGSKMCSFGCMGLGSCVRVCNFDAIYIGVDGIAHVDRDKCTSCGMCLEACPKKIINWIPDEQFVYINCSSHQKGKEVKDSCSVGCIACQICVKSCPENCMEMVNDLPLIDYSKCTQCGVCVEKCPTKAIHPAKEKMENSIETSAAKEQEIN